MEGVVLHLTNIFSLDVSVTAIVAEIFMNGAEAQSSNEKCEYI